MMLWATIPVLEFLGTPPIAAILILLSRNIPPFPLSLFVHPLLFWGRGGGSEQALLSPRLVAVVP